VSKRHVWVVEFSRRSAWSIQMTWDGTGARAAARKYLAEFREVNPGIVARLVKYTPETK